MIRRYIQYFLLGVFFVMVLACNSSSNLPGIDKNTNDTTPPVGTLTLDYGAKFTLESHLTINLNLTVSDDQGIEAYSITNNDIQPSLDSNLWQSVDTTHLNLNVSITLESSRHIGVRYAWVRDKAGHVTRLSDDIEIMRFMWIGGNNDLGEMTSITIDPLDHPYISSYAQGYGDLHYSYLLPDGNISIDPVDEVGNVGIDNSIAADSNGTLHITYRDENNNTLKYAQKKIGEYWVVQTLETGGSFSAVAIDQLDRVHIAHHGPFISGHDVHYILIENGLISSELVFKAEVYNNLSITTLNNEPYILATDIAGMKLIHKKGNDWIVSEIGDVGTHGKIITDGNKLYIVYRQFGQPNGIYVGTFNDEHWIFENIPNKPYATSPSIAIDSKGFLHLCFYDFEYKDLNYATNLSGSWVTSILDSKGDVGNYCDIGIDSSDRLYISYYDATNTNLNFATTADAP